MSGRSRAALLPTSSLVAVTAIWGSTFFMIKDVVGRMPAADMLAVRFAVAALAMLALFPRSLRRLPAWQWRRGLLLGALYGAAQLLQTWGLASTPASVSGFVTGMYVVITPLLTTALFGQRLPGSTWLAALLATLGLALLALHGLAVDRGVGLTLVAAALYALHIVALSRWSRPGETFAMSTVQMLAIAAVCLLATLPRGPVLPPGGGAWIVVLYLALAASAGAMLAQTWAQAHLSATRAAIVMTLEPVFAAAFAVAFGGESPTWRMLAGGALVLAAMYLVELAPGKPNDEALHHEV